MYRFSLPPNISGFHPIFHMSILKRYKADGKYIIKWDSIVLDKDRPYKDELISFLDCDMHKFMAKEFKSVKVQWKCHIWVAPLRRNWRC